MIPNPMRATLEPICPSRRTARQPAPETVERLLSGGELLIRYGKFHRRTLDQVAPAAAIEEPLTISCVRGFHPLLPFHRFPHCSAHRAGEAWRGRHSWYAARPAGNRIARVRNRAGQTRELAAANS